jgi:acetyl-CoA acetyltransferase
LARIHHMTALGSDPIIVLETPIPATLHALKKAGMSVDDIDLFEVNEAFASESATLQVIGIVDKSSPFKRLVAFSAELRH